MRKVLGSIITTLVTTAVVLPLAAFAVQVSVPFAPSAGYTLVGGPLSNGAYAATSTLFLRSNRFVGIGTTTPYALFSINPNGIGSAPALVVGSSTKTSFVITNAGNVGIGTTSPYARLAVVGSTGVVADHYVATSTTQRSTFVGGIDITKGGVSTSTIKGQAYTYQNTSTSTTGTTGTPISIFSKTIKANTLGPNGMIRITGMGSTTNSAGTKTLRIKLGSALLQSFPLTTSKTYAFSTFIFNHNATNAQISPSSMSLGGSTGLIISSSVDTTQDQVLSITCQISVGTDMCGLEAVEVEIIN